MVVFYVFLTLLTLLAATAGGIWAGLLFHRRLSFLEDDCRRLRLSSVEDGQQFDKQLACLGERVEVLERRAADWAQRPARSINYTQRSQMLRMIRRGDPPDQVATTLGVPLSQVRLMMKLPGIAAARPQGKAQSSGQ